VGGVEKDDCAWGWLLGEEPVEVFASASCLVDPAIGAAGDVDTARTLLRTGTGRLCVISNTRRSGYGYDQRIEAYGSAGTVRADNVLMSTVTTCTESGSASDAYLVTNGKGGESG